MITQLKVGCFLEDQLPQQVETVEYSAIQNEEENLRLKLSYNSQFMLKGKNLHLVCSASNWNLPFWVYIAPKLNFPLAV